MSDHIAIPRTQFPLRLPAHIRTSLDAYAGAKGISVNAAAVELISRALAYEIVYRDGLDAQMLGGPYGGPDQEPDQAPERLQHHTPEEA